MANTMLIILMVFGLCAFVGIFIFWWKVLRYPIKVEYWQRRKDGFFHGKDTAKRFTEKNTGKRFYKLKRLKLTIKPVALDYISKKKRMKLYMPKHTLVYPIKAELIDIPKIDRDVGLKDRSEERR